MYGPISGCVQNGYTVVRRYSMLLGIQVSIGGGIKFSFGIGFEGCLGLFAVYTT